MSYTPTEWETGQTITAEKLNKLEQGVADAGDFPGFDIVIWYDYDSWTPSLITGDYTSLRQKIVSGMPVIGLLGASGAVDGEGSVASKCALATVTAEEGYIWVSGLFIGEGGIVCKFNADGTVTDDSD